MENMSTHADAADATATVRASAAGAKAAIALKAMTADAAATKNHNVILSAAKDI